MSRPVVIFLLIASFGILFAGCTRQQPEQVFEEFTFTDDDLQRVQQVVAGDDAATSTVLTDTGTTAVVDVSSSVRTQPSTIALPVAVKLDPAKQAQYDALRVGIAGAEGNVYRVNNPFLNVRQSMSVSSTLVVRLDKGAAVTVLDIPNAEWAKVKMQDGKEGYVSFRYIAKLVSDARLAEEKKKFEGQYYVDYAFLNIRKDPSTQAEKIGELPGQAIIKPLSINGEWARVSFEGKDGYVSSKYLKPFLPTFLVRQDDYKLPVLHYRATDEGAIAAMIKHIAAMKAAGKKVVTLSTLRDLVLAQETRDARIQPGTVVLTISGINARNVKLVDDALVTSKVSATLFIQAKEIGIAGISEKVILTLMANGNDLQSAGHSGDDLRAMTDEQITLELYQSKKLIEDMTRKEVYAILYPAGGVNDRVMQKASQIGYLFGIGQSPDKQFTRDQFLRLPSLFIGSSMSDDDVVKLVK